MEKEDRKRPRQSSDGSKSGTTLPAYGSREYWEERYKKLQSHVCIENQQDENDETEKEPDPFHAWYFTYEELAPLILPLLVGDLSSSIDSVGGHNEEDETCNIASTLTKHSKGGENNDSNDAAPKELEKNSPSGSDDASDDAHSDLDDEDNSDQVESDDDQGEEEEEEEESPTRVGLAKHGPIEILEVGCGDVPLGKDIIHSIKELEQSQGAIVADKILKSVTCIDYSQTVIDAMKSKQKSEGIAPPSIPLEYSCADARKLPYSDERFHFVLEKGTMDAMLSDSDQGSDNCRSIVAEMARVAARGGAIMIISHVNAHTENGINWLNEIVVPGLRVGAGKCQWSVEVHGGDVPDIDCDDDEASANAGPAVYIIHKGEVVDSDNPTIDDDSPPTVPLRFFSY